MHIHLEDRLLVVELRVVDRRCRQCLTEAGQSLEGIEVEAAE